MSIQQHLKRLMKRRQLTYRELAEKVGLSESGVKKLMTGSDLSIVRLSQICEALDIRLLEFTQSLEVRDFEDTNFSEDQQREMLRQPELFFLYWKLVFERCPLAMVKQELDFDSELLQKLLLRLDKLNLIKVFSAEKIQLPKLRPIRSFGEGELVDTVYRDWSSALLQHLASGEQRNDGYFLLRGLKMRAESFQSLLQGLRELEEEFVNRAIREMKIYRYQDLVPISWVSGLLPTSFVSIVQKKNPLLRRGSQQDLKRAPKRS